MIACDAIENDLKVLEKGKSKLEKLTEKQNEEFNIEEKVEHLMGLGQDS